MAMSGTGCVYLDMLFAEDRVSGIQDRKGKFMRRKPVDVYMEELNLALKVRPGTEPLGPRLVEQLNGLLDLPAHVACGILFEYQGRARADEGLTLQEFIRCKVARWERGPGRGQQRFDVLRTWSPDVAHVLYLLTRGKHKRTCVGETLLSDGCCVVPSAEEAKIFRHGTGSKKRSRFQEPWCR